MGRLYYKLEHKVYIGLTKIGVPLCHGYQGPCFKLGKTRDQNTAYVNSDNTHFMCENCSDACNADWQEQWDDFYSGCL